MKKILLAIPLKSLMLLTVGLGFLLVTGPQSAVAQTIDIKPGSDPNPINTKSCGNGVIPVAILGSVDGSNCDEAHPGVGCDHQTCEDIVCALDDFCCNVSWDGICAQEAIDNCDPFSQLFDVTTINVTSLEFEGAPPAHDLTDTLVYQDHLQDVNGDYITDLVSHYRCGDTGIEPGDTEACLSATAGFLASDSDCLIANGTPGCDDATCEAIVGAIDDFCINSTWDSICADEAADLCPVEVAIDSCDDIKTVGGNPNN